MATLLDQLSQKYKNPYYSEISRQALAHEVSIVERALGFRLPSILLRDIYIEIDNLNVGPGIHGLFPLPSRAINFRGHSIVEHYLSSRGSHEVGKPEWPEGLLPICDWGGSIRSSVDCTKTEAPVIRTDPNRDIDDLMELDDFHTMQKQLDQYGFHRVYGAVSDASWVESKSLAAWLKAWLDNRPLFFVGTPKSLRPPELRNVPYIG